MRKVRRENKVHYYPNLTPSETEWIMKAQSGRINLGDESNWKRFGELLRKASGFFDKDKKS